MASTQPTTIIAVCNEKGGTAKTTTSVTLSAALGLCGKKVLLVDLDGQAASSRWLGVENDSRLSEAMARGGGLAPVRDVKKNLSLAPASGKLDSIAHDLRPTQGGQLRKILNELTEFDFILIDCPPSLGNRLIGNALLAATHVLVPVETSILALDGLKILLTTLEDIRGGFGHDIKLGGVLACRFDARTRLSRMVVAELRRALPGKVFETVVRDNVRMRECPASGQTVFEFAPDCNAADDYLGVAREILAAPDLWVPSRRSAAEAAADADLTEQFSMSALRDRTAAAVCAPRPDNAPADQRQDAADPDETDHEHVDVKICDPTAPAADEPSAPADPAATEEFEQFLQRLTEAEQVLSAEKEADEVAAREQAEPSQAPGAGDGPSWQQDVSHELEDPNGQAAGSLRVNIWHDEDVPADTVAVTAAETELEVQIPPVPETVEPETESEPELQPAAQDAPEAETQVDADAEEPPRTESPEPEPVDETTDVTVNPDDPYPALRALHSKLISEGRLNDADGDEPARQPWQKAS